MWNVFVESEKPRKNAIGFRVADDVFDRLEEVRKANPLIKLNTLAHEAFLKGLPLLEAEYLPASPTKLPTTPAQAA